MNDIFKNLNDLVVDNIEPQTSAPITKDVIVFDFDGTIVNSMEAFANIAAEVMPKRLPIDSETARRRYLETSGIPFFQQLELLFPDDPANASTAEEFELAKLEGYLDEPLFEDAVETVQHLRSRGIKVVVSSNNFQNLVDRFVGETGIEFDMVLGFKQNFAKGADHFAHIIETLGVDREKIAFIGDSIKDGERAQNFGIDFIGKEGIFTREQFSKSFPDAKVISTLADLKRMFP